MRFFCRIDVYKRQGFSSDYRVLVFLQWNHSAPDTALFSASNPTYVPILQSERGPLQNHDIPPERSPEVDGKDYREWYVHSPYEALFPSRTEDLLSVQNRKPVLEAVKSNPPNVFPVLWPRQYKNQWNATWHQHALPVAQNRHKCRQNTRLQVPY